jgi:TPR repeat protein
LINKNIMLDSTINKNKGLTMRKLLLLLLLCTGIGATAATFQENKRACEGGEAAGCNNLGLKYDNGEGTKQDYFQAVKYYKRACAGGNAIGCNNLGLMYETGQGVRQSNSKAKELYGKACDNGSAEGCSNYAAMNK